MCVRACVLLTGCLEQVPELVALRAHPPLLNLSDGLTLAPGTERSLGSWQNSVGNSSEVQLWFRIPRAEKDDTHSERDIETESNATAAEISGANCTFGIGIMTSDKPPHVSTPLNESLYLAAHHTVMI